MRHLLCLTATVAALAAPAHADPLDDHGIHRGGLQDAPVAYLACLAAEDGTGARCYVAQRLADGTVRLVVESLGDAAAPVTYDRPAPALTVDAATGAVRLHTTLPGGEVVDVTSVPEAARTSVLVTDGCSLLPMYVELYAGARTIAHAARTTGTVGGIRVRPHHYCTTVVATGPVSGTWRMAGGL